jgi:hypothetical protein
MKHYQELAAKAREDLRKGRSDLDSPEVDGLKKIEQESVACEIAKAAVHSG